jgi:DNA primase
MKIPYNFADEVISKIPVSDVVSKRVALKFNGKEYMGLCPFHNEKTPSFTVNDSKEFYHCFGCGAHGNVVNFVMQNEGIGFKEALVKLAEEYNIPIPKIEYTETEEKEYNEIKEIYKINEEACKFFQKYLFSAEGQVGLNYLKKRGLTQENILEFRLGFSLNSFDTLLNYLKSQKFTEKDILNSGLISKSEKGLYDKFRNRVMFPITDKRDHVIAFSGRVLDDSLPKYMNSPETKIYHKGGVVFNLAKARKIIYDKGFVILVEGNMDAISLYCNGIKNVVAPMGTAITQVQIQELWKITDNIIVCLDGDDAGRKAMHRLSELVLPILSSQKLIKFLVLPDKYDPDSFVKEKGQKAFETLVDKVIPLSQFLWENEIKDLNINTKKISPEEKAKLEANLNKKIELIQDTNSKKHFKDYYRTKLWELTRFAKNDIITHKTLSGKNIAVKKDEFEEFRKHEKNIIATLLKFPEFLNDDFFEIKVRNLSFKDEKNLSIVDLIEDFIENNKEIDYKIFLSSLENKGLDEYIEYSNNFLKDKEKERVKKFLNIVLNEYYLLSLIQDKISLLSSNEFDIKTIEKMNQEITNIERKISVMKEDL